jgi:hypothetical protein
MTDPVAWAVTIGPPDDVSVYEAYAAHQKEEAVAMADECRFGDKDKPLPLAPLYFLPALTAEEREAIKHAIGIVDWHKAYFSHLKHDEPLPSATLRKLLERLT